MHYVAIEEIERILNTDHRNGLTESEAAKRILHYGYNKIREKKAGSSLIILLSQFKSPLVFLLLFASAMSFFFNKWLDGIAILMVLLINAAVGFSMEFQARKSMKALRKLSRSMARVYRQGQLKEIPSEDLVPGDLLFLEAGDIVPADGRVVAPSQTQLNESALTGESQPVEKNDSVLEKSTPLAERNNMVYKGTHLTRGNTKALITGTGMNTELGKIAELLRSASQEATPIERKLEIFSRKLIWITLVLVGAIFIAGVINGAGIVYMLSTSVAMAVAAIPEGLPIVATLALAQGMLTMAKHQVIVKRLAAVETLGGTNVICTDKTGTLTENKIEVFSVVTPDFKLGANKKPTRSYDLILKTSVLCNTAEIQESGPELIEIGDPLETGLLKFAKHNIALGQIKDGFVKLGEEPFSSESKLMATLHQSGSLYVTFAKGATEQLLERCSAILKGEKVERLSEYDRRFWLDEAGRIAASGGRVIAFAWKESFEKPSRLAADLTFLGVASLLDPLRPRVADTVGECRAAGIKVVMITGDHPLTAKNIGLQLGLISSDKDGVIHGNDMKLYEELSDAEKELWRNTRIFARVSPRQKLDLVKVLQEDKSVVAMTGDGVNDAPALKKADIGIAMGLRGTQVAQEASDLVLKDDSFTSIVLAIEQGRIIFDNIRRFLVFLLSCNLSEVFVVASAAIFNFHFRLFPLQILFINLLTDVLPALALGLTEGNKLVMRQAPRDPNSQLLTRNQWHSVGFYSLIISFFTVGAVFVSHFMLRRTEAFDPRLNNNILFYTLILSQLLHSFNMNFNRERLLDSATFRNKFLWLALLICLIIAVLVTVVPVAAKALNLGALQVYDWLIIFFFSTASFILIYVLKRLGIIC